MKTDPDLRAAVILALARVAERDPATLDDDTVLRKIGLDSLMFTSFLLELEDVLGAELPLDVLADAADAKKLVVVADIVRLVSSGHPGS